jgi:hypothetical protein
MRQALGELLIISCLDIWIVYLKMNGFPCMGSFFRPVRGGKPLLAEYFKLN